MNNLTPLLAIETSDKVCGICILNESNEFFSIQSDKIYSHSEALFEQIELIQKQSKIDIKELKSIAVSIGPGSFTGLRIGLAAAKGIAAGLNIPIIPVPTFEAFAFQISTILPEGFSFYIANRASKDECYFGKFFVKSNSYIFDSELKIINQSDLDALDQNMIYGNLSRVINRPYSPDPLYVAKWASNFGIEKLVYDIDFLEPNYIKDFIVRRKNNEKISH